MIKLRDTVGNILIFKIETHSLGVQGIRSFLWHLLHTYSVPGRSVLAVRNIEEKKVTPFVRQCMVSQRQWIPS